MNRKNLSLIFVSFCAMFFAFQIFSYNDVVTHSALTEKAIEIFNNNLGGKISEQQKSWIKIGSINEDTYPRYFNHFYNPETSEGLENKEWGMNITGTSAKRWAFKQDSASGDFSVSQTLENYKIGNYQRAYEGVGHIMHLLQDMSVPAHTRNDPHGDGDPYEKWVEENGTTDKINISSIPNISIEQSFDEMAKFSNNNFLSEGTKTFEIIDDPLVHADYWRALSPEATKYSLVVLNYFVKEFEKIDAEKSKEKVSILKNTSNELFLFGNKIVYVWGDLAKVLTNNGTGPVIATKNFIVYASEKITSTASTIATSVKSTTTNLASGVRDLLKDISMNFLSANIILSQNNLSPAELSNQNTQPENVVEQNNLPSSSSLKPAKETPTAKNITPDEKIILQDTPPLYPPDTHASNLFFVSSSIPGYGGGYFPPIDTATPTDNLPNTNLISETPTTTDTALETTTETTATSSDETLTATTTEPILEIKDETPPEIFISIAECDKSFSQNICLIATTTLNIMWSSPDEDTEIFELTDNQNNIFQTTSTSTTAVVFDNNSFAFSVRAKDKTGNWSAQKYASAKISLMPVVINEVAWAGTSSKTAQDKWIELYNRTDEEINLNDWILFSQTDMGPYIKLSGTISAKGYYLIEGENDNVISDITADWVGSFGESLNGSGEELILSYASSTIDKNGVCSSGGVNWPPCYHYEYGSMERIDPNVSGAEINNWDRNAYPQFMMNGKTSKGGVVQGTPKARNSMNYLINRNQNITTDIVLKKENSPYVVNGTKLNITNGATLTIEPGVVIKFFGDSKLTVLDGKILAQGIESEKVVFTSFADNEYGKEIGTKNSTGPVPGAWFGLEIYSPNSALENILIRYAGKWYNAPGYTRSALYAETENFELKNSTIEKSKETALTINKDGAKLIGNIFKDNNFVSSIKNCAVEIYSQNINVSSNEFINNEVGLCLSSANGVVNENIFENNKNNLSVYQSTISYTNNVGIENDPPPPPPEPIIILETENATSTATTTNENI